MKKENTIIGIALSPEFIKKLDESNYNKSKLIDSLLTEHFKKKMKNLKIIHNFMTFSLS